jgi:hypothetical protein
VENDSRLGGRDEFTGTIVGTKETEVSFTGALDALERKHACLKGKEGCSCGFYLFDLLCPPRSHLRLRPNYGVHIGYLECLQSKNTNNLMSVAEEACKRLSMLEQIQFFQLCGRELSLIPETEA